MKIKKLTICWVSGSQSPQQHEVFAWDGWIRPSKTLSQTCEAGRPPIAWTYWVHVSRITLKKCSKTSCQAFAQWVHKTTYPYQGVLWHEHHLLALQAGKLMPRLLQHVIDVLHCQHAHMWPAASYRASSPACKHLSFSQDSGGTDTALGIW